MSPLYHIDLTLPRLPKRIDRLYELANNLWWSWHEDGRRVFRSLDYAQWRTTGHNPVKQLRDMGYEKLEAAAKDPTFLELYDSVILKFDADMSGEKAWCSQTHRQKFDKQITYFSAEYAIHRSLPIYAGGLGVLAGDICKEASDLGLPLAAVGFMYPQGYFRQRISADGWQGEEYQQLDFTKAPATPIMSGSGHKCLVEGKFKNRTLHIGAWLVNLGRVSLYLLDTALEENAPQDRSLSSRLYTADREQRL